MDFRNVTDLFADPEFDGDPVRIKTFSEDDIISDFDEFIDEEIIDEEGKIVNFPETPLIQGGEIEESKQRKIRVDGVEVKIINERIQYLDQDGKVITETLKDYTKKNIHKNYKTLDSFLKEWNSSEKKTAIVFELEQQGIFFDALRSEIGKEYDPFDLVCHVAFDATPLTRKERADNVKKRNYFTKYGDKAQMVINSLLDKYADDGLLTIESTEVLKLNPLNKIGTPIELIKAFGGKNQYIEALNEMKQSLYEVV